MVAMFAPLITPLSCRCSGLLRFSARTLNGRRALKVLKSGLVSHGKTKLLPLALVSVCP